MAFSQLNTTYYLHRPQHIPDWPTSGSSAPLAPKKICVFSWSSNFVDIDAIVAFNIIASFLLSNNWWYDTLASMVFICSYVLKTFKISTKDGTFVLLTISFKF